MKFPAANTGPGRLQLMVRLFSCSKFATVVLKMMSCIMTVASRLRDGIRHAVVLVFCVTGCASSDAPEPTSAAEPTSGSSEQATGGTRSSAVENLRATPPTFPTVRQPVAPSPQPKFVNSAMARGIDFTFYADRVPGRFFLPEVMGGGVGWSDFDGDGWLDLFLMNGCVLDQSVGIPHVIHRYKLFRNRLGQQFQDVSQPAAAGHSGYGQGCLVGDFDADGFPDFYLTSYGPNILLHNNGDGSFSDITDQAGVGDDRWGTSGVWIDLNSDGNLDLFAANYMDVTLQNNQTCKYGETTGYCGPGRYEGVPDLVFISNGDGTFREGSRELGLTQVSGKGLAVAAADFNNDFLPDLYVANDMAANSLFTRIAPNSAQSESPGPTYIDIAERAGCAVSSEGMNEASMGIACADFDADGRMDIYLTHYYQMKNTLYHNLGDMLFEDDSFRTNVAATSFQFLGFGTVPLDYNGDGRPDLFIANGHVLGPAYDPNSMPPQLLLNNGHGGFTDVSGFAGAYFEDAWLGRGVASCDFDNDGDMDIGISHLDRPFALLENQTPTASGFVGIALSRSDRRPPLGARVTITDDRGSFTQALGAGGSYLSSSDPRFLFAVHGDSGRVQVDIQWPSGQTDHFENLLVNKYWHVIEGRQPEVLIR